VKIWTMHERSHVPPVLVREGFSFGALIFGPFWLAAHRAWVPAGATLLLTVLIPALIGPPSSIVLLCGLALLLGLSGRDLVRWSLALRGYAETGVVAGRDQDEATARMFDVRPDLIEQTMVAEIAP
jgi:hypothetical protein